MIEKDELERAEERAPKSPASRTRDLILQAIGAAYGAPGLTARLVDATLADAITTEVMKALYIEALAPHPDGRMTILLAPTSTITELAPSGPRRTVDARVWEGTDAHGTKVTAFIALVGVSKDEPPAAHERFTRELKEKPTPGAMESWPLRMVVE